MNLSRKVGACLKGNLTLTDLKYAAEEREQRLYDVWPCVDIVFVFQFQPQVPVLIGFT